MTPKKMRSKPYNRPKNGKGPAHGDQLSNFDPPRYENSKPRSPNGNRNYQQLFDKYNNLAREALSGGDRVAAEFHYQYADHYLRLMNERQSQRPAPDKYRRNDSNNEMNSENSEKASKNNEGREESDFPNLDLTEENIVEPIE